MFNVGGPEVLVILLVALIALGPAQLPKAARQVGQVMAEIRRVSTGFQKELTNAFEVEERKADARPEKPVSPGGPAEVAARAEIAAEAETEADTEAAEAPSPSETESSESGTGSADAEVDHDGTTRAGTADPGGETVSTTRDPTPGDGAAEGADTAP